MSLPILLAKIAIVAIFLVMFLRSSKTIWGVGLLTVTTAILLDTLLSTFSRDEILEELGFFYFVIAGALMAGAAFWLWGLLRSWLPQTPAPSESPPPGPASQPPPAPDLPPSAEASGTLYDRQELVDQITNRFSSDDILDLVFDLGLNENDVFIYGQTGRQAVINIVMAAEAAGQSAQMALAVERILTPVPADHLPRLEKLDSNSPPTILRHYLLANCSLADLQSICLDMNIDWEIIPGDGKKAKVRSLLQYCYRRNSVGQLIEILQADGESVPQ